MPTLTVTNSTKAALLCAWWAQCDRIEDVGERTQFILSNVPLDYKERLEQAPWVAVLHFAGVFNKEIRQRAALRRQPQRLFR